MPARKYPSNLLRRMRHASRTAQKRAEETPEERKQRLEKLRILAAAKRAAETPEQRMVRLEEHRMRAMANRARERPEQRIMRLEMGRRRAAAKRAAETPEQRRIRLELGRQRAAARRAAETPEQALYRRQTNRLRAAIKRAYETPEQKRRRLDLVKQLAALRRANETPEKRQRRLEMERMRSAARRALKTMDAGGTTREPVIYEAESSLTEDPENENIFHGGQAVWVLVDNPEHAPPAPIFNAHSVAPPVSEECASNVPTKLPDIKNYAEGENVEQSMGCSICPRSMCSFENPEQMRDAEAKGKTNIVQS